MARPNDIEISFISPTQFVERINCELCFITVTEETVIPVNINFFGAGVETIVPANINFFGAGVDPVETAKLFYQIN